MTKGRKVRLWLLIICTVFMGVCYSVPLFGHDTQFLLTTICFFTLSIVQLIKDNEYGVR